MAKYCSNCGSEITEGAKFCISCSAKIEEKPMKPVEPMPVEPTPQNTQPMMYIPRQPPWKSNTKIIAIVALIVVAVVVVGLFIIFQGNDTNKFVGTWTGAPPGETPAKFQFYPNGVLTISQNEQSYSGTYEITDGEFIMVMEGQRAIYDYYFSNNGRTLTISPINRPGETAILIKQ